MASTTSEAARAGWRGRMALAWPRPRPRRLAEFLALLPARVRARVRADELWLVVVAGLVGAGAGLLVTAMGAAAQVMHEVLYGLPPHHRLSGQPSLAFWRCALALGAGGLAVGGLNWALGRWWGRRAIDPIEANALYGGQVSVRDSLTLVGQTLLSNGVGASVGLEAGYAQIGGALGSRLGRGLRLRRSDLRLLVGCGAGAAIAAAFNGPLTGAFYAFELVIGTYSLATLAPVVGAALAGVIVTRSLSPELYGFNIGMSGQIPADEYLPVLGLGVACALMGIVLMRGVTLAEDLFRRTRLPAWLRPAVGGLAVAVLAIQTPTVLSSGHAALQATLDAPLPLQMIAFMLVLKSLASAISIGAGFRGGLFFASLFLGALLGKLFAGGMVWLVPDHGLPMVVYAVVGMSALAVAVVGGPLTMAFLALESTESLPLTVAVLAASVVSALTVRRTFGYSFATWRFHLRGEAIRSAVDVGWVRNLTVARMMRREVRTVRADTSVGSLRRDFPLGAATRVVAVDAAGRYAGIVLVAEAHGDSVAADAPLTAVLRYGDAMLMPQMTVKEAIAAFGDAESDALAVVDGRDSRRVIGLLTEAYALRRYSEELDRRRRELSGE